MYVIRLLRFNFESIEDVDYSKIKNKRDPENNKRRLEELLRFQDPYGVKTFSESLVKIMEELKVQLNINNDFNEENVVNKDKVKTKIKEEKFNIVSIYKEFVKSKKVIKNK